METLPQFAAAMFRARLVQRRRAVADGRAQRDQAETVARTWAAVAFAAGADLPEIEDQLNVVVIFERDMDDAARRRHRLAFRRRLADELAPEAERRALVRRERDHALNLLAPAALGVTDQPTETQRHTAAMLCALAAALGVTDPYLPKVAA